MIYSSKDPLNINNMNTLCPLQIAKNIKNEFHNLQTGFTEEGLVMFKFEVSRLKEEGGL